jgi:hypothetical protein
MKIGPFLASLADPENLVTKKFELLTNLVLRGVSFDFYSYTIDFKSKGLKTRGSPNP